MRWHKERIHDSKDVNIMSHPTDVEACRALEHFDPEFVRDPRSFYLALSMDDFQPYSCDSTMHPIRIYHMHLIVIHLSSLYM
jgi:hypothetical protein